MSPRPSHSHRRQRLIWSLCAALAAATSAPAAARADALPFDEDTQKGANGATVIHGLDRYPDRVIILYPAGCVSDYGDEPQPTARLGDGDYDYAIVREGAAIAGADYGAPNCTMGAYYALPAAAFPALGGRIPALDRLTLGEVEALLEARAQGILSAGRGPAPWAELDSNDRRSSFLEHVRAELTPTTFRLIADHTEWSHQERPPIEEPERPRRPQDPARGPDHEPQLKPEPGPEPEPRPEPKPTAEQPLASAHTAHTDAPSTALTPTDPPARRGLHPRLLLLLLPIALTLLALLLRARRRRA
ncbi:MAG: hypothetical protein IPK80_17565 [Nannocystis sp.]|nr:hypothetical protein [Nannocystis sp.]